jgi:hypothetical protein
MAGLTLDTGALIAADRNSRVFWIHWKEALRRGVDVTVPTPVIAQAWRGGRNARMGHVLGACVVEPLDQADARAAGELCAQSMSSDAIDAAVVVSAAKRGDAILTSDPDDLGVLLVHAGAAGPVLPI